MFTKYFEMISQALATLNEGSVVAFAALFLVLALGEFGVPFPFVLQGVLFFIGYQIVHGKLEVIPLVLILILGRLFGSAVVYWLARLLGNPFASWFEKRFRTLPSKVEGMKRRLGLPAPLAVAAGRLTPGLLVPTSLTSGAVSLRYEYFALGIALSAAIWDGSFIASGAILGSVTQHLDSAISPWLMISGFAVILGLTWASGRLLMQHKSHGEGG